MNGIGQERKRGNKKRYRFNFGADNLAGEIKNKSTPFTFFMGGRCYVCKGPMFFGVPVLLRILSRKANEKMITGVIITKKWIRIRRLDIPDGECFIMIAVRLLVFFIIIFSVKNIHAEIAIDYGKYSCLNKYSDYGNIKTYISEAGSKYSHYKTVSFMTHYKKNISFSLSWEDIFRLEEINVDILKGEKYLRRGGKYEKAEYYEDIIAISGGVTAGLSSIVAVLLLQKNEYIETLDKKFNIYNYIDAYDEDFIISKEESSILLESGIIKGAVTSYGSDMKFINIIHIDNMEYEVDGECLKNKRKINEGAH